MVYVKRSTRYIIYVLLLCYCRTSAARKDILLASFSKKNVKTSKRQTRVYTTQKHFTLQQNSRSRQAQQQ